MAEFLNPGHPGPSPEDSNGQELLQAFQERMQQIVDAEIADYESGETTARHFRDVDFKKEELTDPRLVALFNKIEEGSVTERDVDELRTEMLQSYRQSQPAKGSGEITDFYRTTPGVTLAYLANRAFFVTLKRDLVKRREKGTRTKGTGAN